MHIRKTYKAVNNLGHDYQFTYWCGKIETTQFSVCVSYTDIIHKNSEADLCMCCARAYGKYMFSLGSKKKDY